MYSNIKKKNCTSNTYPCLRFILAFISDGGVRFKEFKLSQLIAGPNEVYSDFVGMFTVRSDCSNAVQNQLRPLNQKLKSIYKRKRKHPCIASVI